MQKCLDYCPLTVHAPWVMSAPDRGGYTLSSLPIGGMSPSFYKVTPSVLHPFFGYTCWFPSRSYAEPRCCKSCHFCLSPTCPCECNLHILYKAFLMLHYGSPCACFLCPNPKETHYKTHGCVQELRRSITPSHKKCF